MTRKERELERSRRKMIVLLVLRRPVESLPKRKEWPQRHKVISWQGHQNRFCQRKNISSDHQIVRWQRVKVSESLCSGVLII